MVSPGGGGCVGTVGGRAAGAQGGLVASRCLFEDPPPYQRITLKKNQSDATKTQLRVVCGGRGGTGEERVQPEQLAQHAPGRPRVDRSAATPARAAPAVSRVNAPGKRSAWEAGKEGEREENL